MSKSPVFAALAALLALTGPAQADEKAETIKKGAQFYRVCAACHSLQPGVHLSGPSLAGLWGKKAASVADYGRYSKPLKKADIVWDEDTLNAWLADPQAMVPGSAMRFQGIENDQRRGELIAFLGLALSEGGTEKAVKQGLISSEMAEGQIPPTLTETGADQQIMAIRHCRDAYYVKTADGGEHPFWETNVRLKIDTSERGPKQGKPVLLGSGMAGDRVSVVFPSVTALQQALAEKCEE